MYWVYVVYNKTHNKFYIGQTVDLHQRIELHNNRKFKNSYTSRFNGEWVLGHQEKYNNRNEALKREKQLKSYQGRQFLKKFIPL